MKKLLLITLLALSQLTFAQKINSFLQQSELSLSQRSGAKNQFRSEVVRANLDSLVIPLDIKYAYTFDAYGNLLKRETFLWDTIPATWKISAQENLKYDANSYNTLYEYLTYDAATRSWLLANKNEFTYTAQGQVISTASYKTTSQGVFVGDEKKEYTYNANGRQLVLMESVWDVAGNQWKLSRQTQNTYDVKGNVANTMIATWNTFSASWLWSTKSDFTYNPESQRTETLTSSWNGIDNSWINKSKEEVYYNEMHFPVRTISYNWNGQTAQWEPKNQTDRTFDALGNHTFIISYFWNASAKKWDETSKSEMEYKNHKTPTQTISYNWSSVTNSWVPKSKSENSFDSHSNPTMRAQYQWNSTDNGWVGSNKEEYFYDLQKNNNDYYTYNLKVGADTIYNLLTYAMQYRWKNGWEKLYQLNLYYSDRTTTNLQKEQISTSDIALFPNPSSGLVTVKTNAITPLTIELYDAKGQTVLNKLVTSGLPFSTEGLPSGFYSYRFTNGNKTYSGKLVIE